MHHKQESVAMLSSRLPDKLPSIASPPHKRVGWHKRSCAALLGATTLMSLSLSGPASTPAAAQQPAQKPNIIFIMGDDIGWMQPRMPKARRVPRQSMAGTCSNGVDIDRSTRVVHERISK